MNVPNIQQQVQKVWIPMLFLNGDAVFERFCHIMLDYRNSYSEIFNYF
ncbi:MAG: hypothetical protein ACTSRK_19810 [Promethearchaeota archaeon]